MITLNHNIVVSDENTLLPIIKPKLSDKELKKKNFDKYIKTSSKAKINQ